MDGIAWASSAMVAARTRLEIATGNLANVSTDGFRKAVARGTLNADGVQIERKTSSESGALRHTGQPFDLAILGEGSFRVRAPDGSVETTRDGSFSLDRRGRLCDREGRVLLGERSALRIPAGAVIDERGQVVRNGIPVDRIALPADATVRSGFIECADVDAIGEMVTVLSAQRSFESAEKVVSAIDGTRQKSANDVARLK
ncbi:MAG TPA: flagellar hook-basal body complex protein [Candidatus Baltobacteraceae bacterium]|jgi:flagellar basal-body rod protein FlgG|nr:flagellar hook-basal body complex protein [Candidatus Baltobacteraceae bacterium]